VDSRDSLFEILVIVNISVGSPPGVDTDDVIQIQNTRSCVPLNKQFVTAATHINTLQHTATHCNMDHVIQIQNTRSCIPLTKQFVTAATHINTLQHTATQRTFLYSSHQAFHESNSYAGHALQGKSVNVSNSTAMKVCYSISSS